MAVNNLNPFDRKQKGMVERLGTIQGTQLAHRTVAAVARERGQHPAETMIDLALARDLDLFFLQPVANEDQDFALEVRAKGAFTLEQAVRMVTFVPATLWGFADRGLIREGLAADLVVFDPDRIGAEMPEVVDDLPAGARRLVQRCRGVLATVVNGEVLLREGKPTGSLPGRLLRGPLARRS